MFTIRDALTLPVLETAVVVAGQANLDKPITWVHAVDIPDAHYNWERPGILLLTAGFGLLDNPAEQQALIPKLVQEGFAGIIFSTGYYFDAIPEPVQKTAEIHNFPLITLPSDILFIDVSQAILKKIVNSQFNLLQESTRINEQLTQLVLRGEGLAELADFLSLLLKRSIVIENPSFQVVAAGRVGLIDEARKRSLKNQRTTPELAEHLLRRGIYAQMLERMAGLQLPPMPEYGMTLPRYVTPIIVDRVIHGYMWVILVDDKSLTDLEQQAVRHASTVAALMLFKQQAVREAEEAVRGDFFEQLLQGNIKHGEVQSQAHRLGYRLNQPHQILLINGQPESGGISHSLLTDVEQWLEGNGARALLVWRDELLAVVLESSSPSRGKRLAETLVKEMSHPARPLIVGVGTPQTAESNGLQQSYQQAHEALQIAAALSPAGGVRYFGDLGLFHWLYHLPPEQQAGNHYLSYITLLADYDKARNAELVKTLESYLDHGGSLVDSAQDLFIHRNTLLRRLERIQEICQLDLRHPQHQLNLHLAIKGYRLRPNG